MIRTMQGWGSNKTSYQLDLKDGFGELIQFSCDKCKGLISQGLEDVYTQNHFHQEPLTHFDNFVVFLIDTFIYPCPYPIALHNIRIWELWHAFWTRQSV